MNAKLIVPEFHIRKDGQYILRIMKILRTMKKQKQIILKVGIAIIG